MASHTMLAAAVCLLLCLTTGAGAMRGVEPHTPSSFSKFTLKDYLFKFSLPKNKDSIIANSAMAFATAGFSELVFPMKPCTGFIPHFHPHAAETMLAIQGKITIVFYDNYAHKLIKANLGVNQATVVPPNTLHYYYNNMCEETTIVSVLNSNAPGIQIYYDYPMSVPSLKATGMDLDKLIMTKTSNATFDPTKAFYELTNNCMAKCKE